MTLIFYINTKLFGPDVLSASLSNDVSEFLNLKNIKAIKAVRLYEKIPTN